MLANCFPRVELTLHQRSHLLLRQRRPCVSLPPSSVHRADRPSVGALGFGLLVDIIGRKWAFNLTCLITSIFGMLLVRLQALLSPLNLSNTTQAAPKYNYAAICGIYFLSSIGLGGNIPIDATICLEFLPMRRRNLVALLSLWQPVGVVFASGLAYGTAARYRCDVKLPSCHAPGVASGAACCTVASNMGWRYEFIVLGAITLLIFFLRYFVFHFHESPKFLLAKGREQEAIDVLHRIAKFNKAPPPLSRSSTLPRSIPLHRSTPPAMRRLQQRSMSSGTSSPASNISRGSSSTNSSSSSSSFSLWHTWCVYLFSNSIHADWSV